MQLRRPSVFAVLLTLAGIAIFCALGIWQLERASYKEAVLARFHHASVAPLESLAQAASDPRPNEYPHVRVTGRLQGDRVYLLDDQMRSGRLGVMVFVPLIPEGSVQALLVNLGFLAKMGADTTTMPDLPPIPQREVTLTGIYAPPPLAGLKLGGNPLTRQQAWPKVVTWIDPHLIAADLHRTLYPHVLLLDPDPHSTYLRHWTANVMPPERHRAYALQWFSFAIASIVMFLVLHRIRHDDDTADERE